MASVASIALDQAIASVTSAIAANASGIGITIRNHADHGLTLRRLDLGGWVTEFRVNTPATEPVDMDEIDRCPGAAGDVDVSIHGARMRPG